MNKSLKFSQKHPLLFGFGLIFLAMALITGAMAFFTFRSNQKITFNKVKIGVVYIEGIISNALPILDWIEQLKKDEEIKGILVRINSPGGVVGPSQEIYTALKEASQKKIVVASLGGVAASGGYYVALGAHKIIANPGTLTGSIGVKAQLTNFQKLMEKIGIEEETITSGKLKNAGTPFKKLSPEEKAYFEELVQDLYQQFITAVMENRKLTEEQVKKIADGRAITGSQALKYGLIDDLGNFYQALETLKTMLHIKKEVVLVEGPPKKKDWLSSILGSLNLSLDSKIYGPTWIISYE